MKREPVEYTDKKSFLAYVAETDDKLKEINVALAERTDGLIDKINSFKDLAKKLKGFLSPRGHSKLLGTSSLFKKLFWLACSLTLFSYCVRFVGQNTREFHAFGVVTEIKNKQDDAMVFPAVTFCLKSFVQYSQVPKFEAQNLSDAFIHDGCNYQGLACSWKDFEYFQVYNLPFNKDMHCYKFNGDTNLRRSSSGFGAYSGLKVQFNLSIENQLLYYYVGESSVRPHFTEITNIVQPGKFIFVGIRKVVDKKLPEPFSSCQSNVSSASSHYVKQILEQNTTYRQKNCRDLCVLEYAEKNGLTRKEAYGNMSLDDKDDCWEVSPVECETITFERDENILDTSVNGNSRSVVTINLFYSDNRYTEIVQSQRKTNAEWIANGGGVLGLFLKVGFLTAYRVALNVFEVLTRI